MFPTFVYLTCVGFTRINDNLLKFMRNELKKKSKGNSVVDTIHFKEQSPYQLKILSTSSDIILNDVSMMQ